MNILGIETSCDETAAAVVKDGREVLSNVVYTQIPLHQPYGGVVPEIASRAHVEKIGQVVRTAIESFRVAVASDRVGIASDRVGVASDRGPSDSSGASNSSVSSDSRGPRDARDSGAHIDAVAVTYGPGLSPALIVGLNAAKGLAKALKVPLVGINHIEAHLHTPFLYDTGDGSGRETGDVRPEDVAPALGLAISGGNTMWVDMPEYGRYEVIGETLDDAAGEAFDKAAKLLNLGYPGGLKMDRISKAYFAARQSSGPSISQSANQPISQSDDSLIPFPKGRPRDGVTALAGLPAELCVSFSGLKTALLRYVQQHPELLDPKAEKRDFGGYEVSPAVAHVVASYQEAIVQAVADRTRAALRSKRYRTLLIGGGVSLNSRIRAVLAEVAREAGVPLLMAKPKYTGDNGAMIAGLAYYRRNHVEDAMTLDVNPCLQVGL